jgi:hypothetical protein
VPRSQFRIRRLRGGEVCSAGSDILMWLRPKPGRWLPRPKPGKVDAGSTAGEAKSVQITGSTRGARPSSRSAQIKGAVRVHQESLIR